MSRRARARRRQAENDVMAFFHLRVLEVHAKTAAKQCLSRPPASCDRDGDDWVVFGTGDRSARSYGVSDKLTALGIAFDEWQGPHDARWLNQQHHVRFTEFGELVNTFMPAGANTIECENLEVMLHSDPEMDYATLSAVIERLANNARVLPWFNQHAFGEIYVGLQLLEDPNEPITQVTQRPPFIMPWTPFV